MLFKVEMTVNIPKDLPVAEADAIKLKEKKYSQELQEAGIWVHLWRVVGQYSNVSIFDVKDNAHLHEILTGLPLYPFMTMEVTALCQHPSSIK
ncbi:MAG: muconolactone Delta-isomerase [Gammaproteobacteria bacterium]|uniref:Muconolactone Delta-isomerase n=1 Tax=Marinomonas polaris DSM 16579 TaxID=1122206 RepID=A0A1M4V698_9GAMM|nr:muconolactone Delta-isomerase [Marinomonas polaris]MBU1294448.1 muconolactone Delta-isomerase [Gammaproteobacteria bacterium]MBU1467293.1 muconolactone Delta-isomerase [Gammaproteobacteria bacterium]MBU2024262.1 muconolactone Delta-isomerase [Gammaproteobacteria bacterium]MBU2237677.1 muconolactone Delta-isomerase [Gammaproteobacteria bacterium]MBU2320484.1 muconolactone Delta-isomerase [Gammaproteobacteria bacterium]